MKYGESTFDILYLLFAIISGIVMLRRASDKEGRLMGLASLILGLGDAFHLVPRVMNYFLDSDLTTALGIGKLVTSVTMTVFYVLLFYIWRQVYGAPDKKATGIVIWSLAAIRVALCMFPQNGWLSNNSDVTWGIIRNVPFVILGAIICVLFFLSRKSDRTFRFLWLLILLSFAFYIPVAVGAGIVPMLGMLMLPKTICYILMIVCFLKKTSRK